MINHCCLAAQANRHFLIAPPKNGLHLKKYNKPTNGLIMFVLILWDKKKHFNKMTHFSSDVG